MGGWSLQYRKESVLAMTQVLTGQGWTLSSIGHLNPWAALYNMLGALQFQNTRNPLITLIIRRPGRISLDSLIGQDSPRLTASIVRELDFLSGP